MTIKRSLRRLREIEDFTAKIADVDFAQVPITLFHADQAGNLPLHHKDPFDQMLIARAQAERLTIVIADDRIRRYGVRTMAARR